ncbi:MAG: phosphogluconate dehydratase, partial [Gammaproteobacteria bacterium]|nr:phosphogluconate dehydratase [Gammaproteobacteria bacterium]
MPAQSPKIHVRVREVTERIRERSRSGRADYLARMEAARQRGSARAGLSCTNLAHGFAASDATDKEA